MGIPDYDLMFDLLDTSLRGYLTIDQLQEFQMEVYFAPLDVRQIEAAIRTVCGRNAEGICPKEYFGAVVEELGRRVLLEESIGWDFKCLDVTGSGRISLSSALLLFKCVHGEFFSLQTWNKFTSSRQKTFLDVSFDEIKLWLCELPTGGPCEDEEFFSERGRLETQGGEQLYEEWNELEKIQEDNYVLAEREAIRNNESSKLKQKSKQRIRRLEKEGINAILYDYEFETEDDEGRRGRHQVGASDLLSILKTKYELLREKLLFEQIQHEVGEGMWSALPKSEQEVKLVHSKLEARRLSASDSSVTGSDLGTATVEYQRKLLALLGHGRLNAEHVLNEENTRRSKLEDEGKTEAEIHEILQQEWKKQLEGRVDSRTMLRDICHRYQEEKELMKNRIRGDNETVMTVSQRLQEFKLIYREHLKASLEQTFESACLAVGVAETSANANEIDRFHFAQELQEQLAERILAERRGHKLQTEFNQDQLGYHVNEGGIVEQFEDVIKSLEKKHRAEVEMMVHMLQGKDSSQTRTEVRKMTSEERDNQFVVIKTQRQGWRNRSSEEKLETKSTHVRLLQEAVSIVYVNKRSEMNEPGADRSIAVSLLAKLLQQQELDARTILAMKEKTSDELLRIREEQEQMYKEQWLDNLSAVILGTSDITQLEDDIIKLLEEKYDIIRQKVLEEALRDQTGVDKWENTPEVERYNLVTKAKANEKKFRVQKRFSGALKLLGDGFMNSEKFMSLLGENRQAFMEKLKAVIEKRRNRLSEGLEPESTQYGIEEKNMKSSGNLWKDLDERYKNEKQLLVQRLQEGGSGPREVSDTMVRLQQQKRLTKQEPNMLCALLVLGLYERHRKVVNERLTQDEDRRHLLAEEQFVLARLRRGEEKKEMEDSEPNKDDSVEWMDAVLREVERKQRMERQFFTSLLLDNALEDLRSEAKEMSEDERQKRLLELKDERDALDLDEKGDQDMNHTILEMACGFKLESRRFRLKNSRKESRVTDDIVFVSLLVDLHKRQNDECEEVLEEMLEKSKEELAVARAKQIQAFKSEYMENVASVLTTYDGLGTNDEILTALENKYDALRDKLLLEALRKQLGEDEWKRLSEKERQLRLMKLKLEAKRLRRDNKLDELAKLLGEGFAADVNLRKLLGENREKYEQQLREKLARRRERLAKGLPAEDSDDEDIEKELTDGKSVLESLERRYEDERDALMAKLLGANNQFLSERERQALLARLKREQMKAKLEEKFGSAALVLGLAERQRKDAEERLMSDRARHEQLARQRLEERRNRKNRKALSDKDIISEGDNGVLQEAVLKMLENKHCEEREVLINLLENEDNALHELALSMTSEQREEHIRELKVKKNGLAKDDTEMHRQILQESATMKFISRQRNLELNNSGEEIPKNTVVVSLMADLQQEQDKESEILIALLPDKNQGELVDLQTRLLAEARSEVRSNLMTVFGTPEQVTSVGEEQLLDALDAKYDTLRDKLLAEALMKQMGAAEWQALSEQERQAKLVKMKLEEKRLRKEGKLDELQALLGAAFDAEANFQELMGKNKARYKERMREKLEKRRQRLKEGMSKDEVARLEAEEDKQFEEELKQDANVNPLLDLLHCYDKEKEALLLALRNNDARFASERQRQAELARLRREERKARQEDKYDTAALVLGLAQAQKANLEELQKKDRLRQEQLARERIAARRRKKSQEAQNELREKEEEALDEISDKENLVALQEAVLKEMEKKQECERAFLQKLLLEEEKSDLTKKTQKKKKEKRTERLIELKELREQWRDSGADGTRDSEKEHDEILREAVCLNIVSTMEELKAKSDGGTVKNEDAHVVILANLQQIQDQEAEILLRDLSSKTAVTLTQLRAVQHQAKRYRWYDNIAASLLGMKHHMRKLDRDDVPTEEELLNALEEKYDALKDKLIAESLMNELGAAEWGKLTERERQAKILKIRLQERKLRQEGRIDEANRLFGEGLEHAASLSKLMGETKAQQKDALRRRLQKLRELKAAGIEMTTEEAQLLEDEMEDEAIEEEVSTEDVIRDLQARYEEEKKALLASLSGQDKRFSSERQRQLELARLRREQKKIAKEDKFDAAALVLGLAKQQEAAKEASYRKDRARHEQLARERLAKLKAKRAEKEAALVLQTEEEQRMAIEKKLQEDHENEKNLLSQEALEIQKGGVVAIQEAVLREVEKKHAVEIKMLSELLDVSDKDAEAVAAASYLNDKQRDEKLTHLFDDYRNWKAATVRTSKNASSDIAVTKEEKEQNILRTADNQMKLMKILKDGIVLKVMNLKEQLLAKGIPEAQVKDELSVALVANLQEKQTTEDRAVENVLAEKDEATLSRVKDDQRRIRQQCIVDNLAAVVLQKDQETVEESSEVTQMEEENIKQLAEMEAELEEEKRKKLLTGASEADVMAALDEIKRQQEAKKRAMSAALERQRNLAKAKLEARRRRRDDKQYEEDIAASLLMMAERESSLVREKTMIQRSKQGESLQERLARRREERARRKAQEEMEKNAEERGETNGATGGEDVTQENAGAERFVERTEKLKDKKPSLPDGFSMKREKTVVDVEVSEDKKKEIVGSLLREHTTFGMGFERERKRQEEALKERRMRKKSNVVAAAATIVGLGERQKTMVEQKRKEERERQLTMVRDRISRVRYERTMTMREPQKESKGFDHILTQEEAEGLSAEDRMKLIAAKMEEKFKFEERRASTTHQSPPILPEESGLAGNSHIAEIEKRESVRLDEKGKERKLKERQAARKRAKKEGRMGNQDDSSAPVNDPSSSSTA